jgi:hypothetical protein
MTTLRRVWHLELPPPAQLKYAFFLSHVGEDKDTVLALKAEIERRSTSAGGIGLRCFIDIYDWQSWNDLTAVIRDDLSCSAHMVIWITPKYLSNKRGWVWVEFAYAELLERNWSLGQVDRYPFIVPIFRGLTLRSLERTPLLSYWERRVEQPRQPLSIPDLAAKLIDFHQREKGKRQGSRTS